MSNDQKELVVFNQQIVDVGLLVEPVLKIKVADFPSSQAAIDAGKSVKELLGRIEMTRKSLVAPLNARVKEINNYARDVGEPLSEAETHIKSELVNFEKEQEKLRAIAHKKAEEERLAAVAALKAKQLVEQEAAAMFGANDTEILAMEVKAQEEASVLRIESEAAKHDIDSMGIKNTRKTWKCELIDINLVPKEFLTIELNEKAVLAMARAGVLIIPGVRLYQETSVAIGAHTYVPQIALKSGR